MVTTQKGFKTNPVVKNPGLYPIFLTGKSWCTANGKFYFKNAVRFTIEVCFDVKPELRIVKFFDIIKFF
jgi:hypothetical protein